jgi:hypothetical protein
VLCSLLAIFAASMLIFLGFFYCLKLRKQAEYFVKISFIFMSLALLIRTLIATMEAFGNIETSDREQTFLQ